MDLKKEILDFLETKKEWETLQKIYYMYLKSCEVFSYNNRFIHDDKNKEQIYNKRVNINCVKQFEIVCSTWCHLMKDLLKTINIEAKIEKRNRLHVFLVIDLPPYKVKMDPTELGHDFTRVKLGNTTTGFIDLNNNVDFENKIIRYDQIIRKEKMTYASKGFTELQRELKEANYFQNNKFDSSFSNKIFISKMELIKDFINFTSRIQNYGDYFYYLNYLIIKIMTELERNKIHNYPFWHCYDDDNWDILHLILLELYEEPAICYKMSKKNKKYEITNINYEEMNYYLDNYEGEIKGLYRGLTM